MNVLHRSRMDSTGTALDEIYAPMIPVSVDLASLEEVQEPEPRRPQHRMGYFDLHPHRRRIQVGGDEDMLDQFAQAAEDIDAFPRRSYHDRGRLFDRPDAASPAEAGPYPT